MDSNSVDLIYLDPPFNKKRTFNAPIGSKAEGASFKDTWYEEDTKDEWIGLIADSHPALHDYLDGIGRIGDKSNKYYLVYMAIRLLELKRILKDTGSLYLHCDTTMSHFLKLLLDCIFGADNFRNEIVWCYRGAGYPKKDFGNRHDLIYRYSKSSNYIFYLDNVREEYADATKERFKHHIGNIRDGIDYGSQKLNPKGKHPDDWWQIQPIAPSANERLGYPTQKPIKLLERIIKASTSEGDLVLDPFCGCATTCVAAEKLGRQWIGIDVSPRAFDLVKLRLNKEIADESDLLKRGNSVIYREDIPIRSDLITSPIKKVEIKHILYGKQRGQCAGCDLHFQYQNMTIDHILPKQKGGQDNSENLQLLCNFCNSTKGDNDMAYLKTRLKEQNIIR